MSIDRAEFPISACVTTQLYFGFQSHFLEGDEIRTLVERGYNLDSSKDNINAFIQAEFPQGDDISKAACIAFCGNRVVASLSLNRWGKKDDQGYNFFTFFFNNVQDTTLWHILADHEMIAYEVSGMVTHPDFRRQGIAMKLIRESIPIIKPPFYIAQARTCTVALALAHGLEPEYVTFFGGKQISRSNRIFVPDHIIQIITDAYCHAKAIRISDIFHSNGFISYTVGRSFVKGELEIEKNPHPSVKDVTDFMTCCQSSKRDNAIIVAPVIAVHRRIVEQLIALNQKKYYLLKTSH